MSEVRSYFFTEVRGKLNKSQDSYFQGQRSGFKPERLFCFLYKRITWFGSNLILKSFWVFLGEKNSNLVGQSQRLLPES